MGEGRIPWLAVNEYARRHHLNDFEFDELWEVVRLLDDVYTDAQAAKAKVERSRIGNQPKKKAPR